MPFLRATVTLDTISGIDKDESKNVWHFATAAAPTQANYDRAANGLATFYNAIATYLGPELNRQVDPHRIDVAVLTPGSPGVLDDTVSSVRHTRRFSLTTAASGGIGFPSEVAITLSFAGDLTGVPEEDLQGAIRPRSRRRGRIFLGPIAGIAAEADATTRQVKITLAARTAILDAYAAAVDGWKAGTATDAVQHVIYSRVEALTRPVVEASVNDEFDTVRRRSRLTLVRQRRQVTQLLL